MPASSFDLYMQEARNNFDAMRPAPVCVGANQTVGQCQQIHISTDCYYGYHEAKIVKRTQEVIDCEMKEAPPTTEVSDFAHTNNARKRSASDEDYHQTKRLREGMFHSTLGRWKLSERRLI